MEFARRVDAERALAAIAELDIWEGSPREVYESVQCYGVEELRRRMTEHLAW